MTSLLHALRVFEQMGYHEQISPLQRVAFEAFSESGDKPLRFESWNQLVGAAPSREQLLAAMDTLGSPQFDGSAAIIAAQALLNDFPNAVTLEVLSEYVPTLEYAGHPTTSQQLVETIEHQSSKLPEGNSLMAIQSILNERKLRLSWAGRELGQLDLVDLNGKAVSQESLEGKVVLVQFWASWSLPCLRELPYLENCYGKLKAKGFEILSINMDSELNAMLAFIKEHPADWPIYRHSNNDIRLLTQQFGITMFPHSLLIDQTGKVVRVNLRGPEMETELVRLLGN